ncbi:MAG: FtsX-like permease family protein [Gemmatimonadota bacterium]|nr:FtsX-like permease family protein [Gemmatimonadota bacterium]
MRRIPTLLRLAARGVRREARRSLLTASAMALGLALLMFTRSLADGGHEDWIDAGVRMGAGHVLVQAPGYRESQSLDDRLSGNQAGAALAALAVLEGPLAPLATTVRLSTNGLASSASSALPVVIDGVDPQTEAGFSQAAERITEGRYLEPGDRLAAYVGQGLVERLGLSLGSRFVLTAQATDGEIQGQLVRVVGVFRTGLPEVDEGLVHIPISIARSWLGAGDAATTVGALLPVSAVAAEVAEAVRFDMGTDDVRVLGWREAYPELDAALRIDDYGDYVFHGILFAIVALAVLNTVLMAVLHRKREFGVLQALGLTPAETGLVVFTEGFLLTALAGVVGMIAGATLTWVFFRNGLDFSFFISEEMTFAGIVIDPVIVPEFRMVQVMQSFLSIAVVGTVASIYPAYHATKIDVGEALKFE